MLVKDLFGDIVDPVNGQDDPLQNESESDEDGFGGQFVGQDESFKMADNLASGYFDGGPS